MEDIDAKEFMHDWVFVKHVEEGDYYMVLMKVSETTFREGRAKSFVTTDKTADIITGTHAANKELARVLNVKR